MVSLLNVQKQFLHMVKSPGQISYPVLDAASVFQALQLQVANSRDIVQHFVARPCGNLTVTLVCHSLCVQNYTSHAQEGGINRLQEP